MPPRATAVFGGTNFGVAQLRKEFAKRGEIEGWNYRGSPGVPAIEKTEANLRIAGRTARHKPQPDTEESP